LDPARDALLGALFRIPVPWYPYGQGIAAGERVYRIPHRVYASSLSMIGVGMRKR